MIELEELEKLVEAGTPGPWELLPNGNIRRANGEKAAWKKNMENNEALLVAAVNALPELIAMARRVEDLEAALVEVSGCFAAAEIEGLHMKLFGECHQYEVGDLHDLVTRRLLPAAEAARNAMTARTALKEKPQ
jgi:hypothetical protein